VGACPLPLDPRLCCGACRSDASSPSTYGASAPPPLAPAPTAVVANGPLVCLLESLRVQAVAVVALCDWQLAAKMVMLVVLLNPGDPRRMATVCGLAFLAYLYQTGILALFLGPMFGRPRDVPDDADQAPPQPPQDDAPNAQPPLAVDAAAPAPAPLEHGLAASLTHQVGLEGGLVCREAHAREDPRRAFCRAHA
jgi:hypothetical protein